MADTPTPRSDDLSDAIRRTFARSHIPWVGKAGETRASTRQVEMASAQRIINNTAEMLDTVIAAMAETDPMLIQHNPLRQQRANDLYERLIYGINEVSRRRR